jgi:SAM-dependent methyltransferase
LAKHARSPRLSDPDLLESVPCALCGADDAEVLRDDPPWKYVRCRGCRLIYVSPRPKPEAVEYVYKKKGVQDWVKRKTYGFRKMADLKNVGERLRRGEELVDVVGRYKTGGRLLDIGCNRGFLLANAVARGFEGHGIEIVEWQTKMVEAEFGVTIHHRPLREIDPPFPDGFFDAITLVDIVEHFYDPVADLGELHRILADDGFMLVNTPDAGSAYARVMGDDWLLDKPEEHLYLFDRGTLAAMLAKTGFAIERFEMSMGAFGEMDAHVRKAR